MAEQISEVASAEAFVKAHPAAVLYFSGEDCSVCHVLYPKVEAMLQERFPKVELARINCTAAPEAAAQFGVFAVPTVVIYFDGHEAQRFARNFSIGQLQDALERPYQMLFE